MYAVGDTHSHMFPVGDGGGEEDLSHVRSGGCSVTHVPSGEWWRRGGSVSCTQWGTLTHICSQWGMGEEDLCHVHSGGHSLTYVPSGGWERRICVMYAVGDTH